MKLPDNYKLLEMCQRPAAIYGWCRCCESEAVEACLDKHPSNICSLAKARSEKLQPQIDKLDAAHAALGHLGQVLDSVEQALPGALCECRTQLEQEAGRVEAKRSLLQAAMTTDPMQWIKAETKDKDDDGGQVPAVPLGEAAASLLTDLTNPATTCSLTVTRHAGPGQQGASAAATWPAGPRVAWRGSVPPRDDPAARLLLCRLLCRGGLRPDTAESLNGAPAAGSGSWTESGNEVEMTGRDMARLMAVGSRVARGLDWHPHWQADGTPPGQGSVVAVLTEGGGPPRFCVRWDATLVPAGASATDPRYALPYSMEPGCFHLALLPNMPQAMVDSSGPGVHNLSITSSQAATTKKLPALTVLSNARTVVGLRCDVNPNWSKKVLHQVAGTVEVLSLISAQQQHLKVCRGMARLRLLHLCGSPVLVEPLVDLTVDPPAAGPGCSGGVPIKPDPDPVEEAGEKAPLPTALRELHIFNATQEQLLQIPKLTALRRLELHCPFTSPLPPGPPTPPTRWR